MHDIWITVLLGIIEGLTEFLPVSSTAHLRIAEALLHIDLESGYWKMYSIVIQLGAILCLPIYFRKRILKFLGSFPKGERGDRTVLTHPLTLVMIAFVVTAIPAFLLSKTIGKNLESLRVMGYALLLGGIVMWVVDQIYGWTSQRVNLDVVEPGDRSNPAPSADADATDAGASPTGHAGVLPYRRPSIATPGTARMEDMTLLQAVFIGAAQILSAIFPGTSRSMSTITAGELAGMSRPTALEFSFFLSIPTMVVATGYDFLKTVVLRKSSPGETLPPIQMDAHGWIVLAIGFVVSFLVAWAVVAWFMSWVRRRGLIPFAVYRIIVGGAVLVWVFTSAKP